MPEEFIEIVKESRKRMAEQLKARGMEKEVAETAAKKHIKGMLDTSHLSMWYKHFAPEKGESEEKRLKRFNEWMKQEVKLMVKEGVVGGIQVVDSMNGNHAHLPVKTVTPGPGGPRTWGGVQNSYFGRATGGPNYIVGAYAPSNDWQLWSETPFE